MALQVQQAPQQNLDPNTPLNVTDADTISRVNAAIAGGMDPKVAQAKGLAFHIANTPGATKDHPGANTVHPLFGDQVGTTKDKILSFLPAALGTLGAIGGGIATGGLGGEVVGGAGGAGIGDELKQYIQGNNPSGNEILAQTALGGVGSLLGAGIGKASEALGVNDALGSILGKITGKAASGTAETGGSAAEAKILSNPTQDLVDKLRARAALGPGDYPKVSTSPDESIVYAPGKTQPLINSGEKPLGLPKNASQGITLSQPTKTVIRDNLAGKTYLKDTGFTLPGSTNASFPAVESSAQPSVADRILSQVSSQSDQNSLPRVITGSNEPASIPESDDLSTQASNRILRNQRVNSEPVATVSDSVAKQPDGTVPTTKPGTLTKLGNALRSRVLNPQVSASPYGSLGEQSLIDAQKAEGLSGTAQQQYAQLPQKMADLSSQITDKLATNTNTVPARDVLNSVFSKIDENPSVLGDKGAVQDAKQIIQQKFESTIGNKADATAQDVVNFKQSLGDNASKLFSKASKGQPLTQAEQAYLTAWQSVDNVVNDVAPEVKDLTLRQSNLYKMSGGLEENRGKGVINIPFVKNVGATAQQAVTDATGKVLQRVGGIGAQNTGESAATGLSGALTNRIANAGGHLITNGPQTMGEAPVDQQVAAPQEVSTDSSPQPSPTATGITDDQYGKLALADVLKTGGKNLAAISALKNLTVPKAPSSSDVTANANLSTGLTALDELEQASNNVNTDSSRYNPTYYTHQIGNKVAEFGGSNPDIATLDNSGTQVIAALKALTGTGRLNQTEIANASVPSVGDTKAEAQTKLNNLKRLLLEAKNARSTN